MIKFILSKNEIALLYDALEAYKMPDDKDNHCQMDFNSKLDMLMDFTTSFELALYPEEYA